MSDIKNIQGRRAKMQLLFEKIYLKEIVTLNTPFVDVAAPL